MSYDPNNPYAPSSQTDSPDVGSQTSAPFRQSASPLADVPPPPRTPGSFARDVIYGFAGKGPLFIVAMSLIVMGALTSAVFGGGVPSDVMITLFGKETQGTLVSRSSDMRMSVNGEHPALYQFQYSVNGTSYGGVSSTLGEIPKELQVVGGASVTVEEVPFAPSMSRIKGTTCSESGFMTLFTLFLPLAGVVTMALLIRARNRRRRAYTNGIAAVGTVSFKGLSSYSQNKQHDTILRWSFRDSRGQMFEGSFRHIDASIFAQFSEHDPVIILYVEDDPRINTLYLA